MAVSAHLNIPLDEYDARIQTFIPWYDEMLSVASASLRVHGGRAPVIVDLGIGSGALSAKCVTWFPRAKVVGVDSDAGMLAMAATRLGARLTPMVADFERAGLPKCDAIVSAFALHHVPTPKRKAALYQRGRRALRPGASLVIADCQLSSHPVLAAEDRRVWLDHLEQYYTPAKARGFLRAWADEDFYFTLDAELALLRDAGFAVDVRWRRHSFAVIVATRVD